MSAEALRERRYTNKRGKLQTACTVRSSGLETILFVAIVATPLSLSFFPVNARVQLCNSNQPHKHFGNRVKCSKTLINNYTQSEFDVSVKNECLS